MRAGWRVVSVFVGVLSGCGGTLASSANPALIVVNHSDFSICGVYVSPAAGPESGPNRLARGRRLPPGHYQSFAVERGRYHVRLEDCAARPLFARRGVTITGTKRLDFRPVEVHRRPIHGSRRFASGIERAF